MTCAFCVYQTTRRARLKQASGLRREDSSSRFSSQGALKRQVAWFNSFGVIMVNSKYAHPSCDFFILPSAHIPKSSRNGLINRRLEEMGRRSIMCQNKFGAVPFHPCIWNQCPIPFPQCPFDMLLSSMANYFGPSDRQLRHCQCILVVFALSKCI